MSGHKSKQTTGRNESNIISSVTGARITEKIQALARVPGIELSNFAISGNVKMIAPRYTNTKQQRMIRMMPSAGNASPEKKKK